MSESPPLDPVIHQPVRMQILAALHRNRQLSFPTLRDGLALTPGNLGAHLERLEQAGYISSARVLSGVSFEMRYRVTSAGDEAFLQYVRTLREILGALAPTDEVGTLTPRARDRGR